MDNLTEKLIKAEHELTRTNKLLNSKLNKITKLQKEINKKDSEIICLQNEIECQKTETQRLKDYIADETKVLNIKKGSELIRTIVFNEEPGQFIVEFKGGRKGYGKTLQTAYNNAYRSSPKDYNIVVTR